MKTNNTTTAKQSKGQKLDGSTMIIQEKNTTNKILSVMQKQPILFWLKINLQVVQ